MVQPLKKCCIHKVVEKYQIMNCEKMHDLMKPWVVKYHKKYGDASLEFLEAQVAEEDWEELENDNQGEQENDIRTEVDLEEMDPSVDNAEQAKIKQIKMTKHSRSWMLLARKKVSEAAWQEESQEVKEHILEAIEEEKKEMLVMLDMEQEGLERDPEQQQFTGTIIRDNDLLSFGDDAQSASSPPPQPTSATWNGPYNNDLDLFDDTTMGSDINNGNANIDPALINTIEPMPVTVQLINSTMPSSAPPNLATSVHPSPFPAQNNPAQPITSNILPTSQPLLDNLNMTPEDSDMFLFPQHLFNNEAALTNLPLTGTWPRTGPQLSLSSPWQALRPQASFPSSALIIISQSTSQHNPIPVHTEPALQSLSPVALPHTVAATTIQSNFMPMPATSSNVSVLSLRSGHNPRDITSTLSTDPLAVITTTTPSDPAPTPFPGPPSAAAPTTMLSDPMPTPTPAPFPLLTPTPSPPAPCSAPLPLTATGTTTTSNVSQALPIMAPTTMLSQSALFSSTPAVPPALSFPQTRLPLKPAPTHKVADQNVDESDVGTPNGGKGQGKGWGMDVGGVTALWPWFPTTLIPPTLIKSNQSLDVFGSTSTLLTHLHSSQPQQLKAHTGCH
ncbi:hypothetical protein DXG01_006195 [Tephrocybe rancida]|nr:hypothetical protein DXG01_006195 [Tephrocybe rancida]